MNSLKARIATLSLIKHLILAAAAFVAFRVANIILDASYARSLFPVPYQEGQTAFDGALIKSYYKTMMDAGTLDVYWQTQFIDFAFIGSLFCVGLLLPLLARRMTEPGNWAYKILTVASTLVPLGAMFDVVENLISFVMLSQPESFPDWIALVYSSFAVLKFGAIGSGYISFFVGLVLALIGWLWRRFGK